MKSTLMCVHVMPSEIEMFQRWMKQFKKSLEWLESTDDITLYAVLNLNYYLTDWENSELNKLHFHNLFMDCLTDLKCKSISTINYGTDLMGTTQHKRECIQLDYDQFIFCDTDIAFPEYLLKYQLNASYHITAKNYIIIPNTIRLWDATWDCLVHKDFLNKDHNYYKTHNPNLTYYQETDEIGLKFMIGHLKFGCGMHTMYSKGFWNIMGIPESFGGYGPEDTFAMFAGNLYNETIPEDPILEYVLEGIYITENYIDRIPSFEGKIKPIDLKSELRATAEANFGKELEKFRKNMWN